MPTRVPDEATCAICGRHFDPSETRGWCPNPNCGEWQHPSFPVEEESSESGGEADGDSVESSPSTTMKACPNCGNEVRANANFCKHCATQLTGTEKPQPTPETTDDGVIDECPDCGADLSGMPSDQLSECPICWFEFTPVDEEKEDATSGDEPGQKTLAECPNCGEDLTPIPEDLRTVCPGCRADLESLDADADMAETPGVAEQTESPPVESEDSTSSSSSEQETDPASVPLDSMDVIASGYVQRLSEVGITTIGELVRGDPDTISANTGISAQRIRNWIDVAPVDPEDVDSGGQEPETESSPVEQHETEIQRSPDELVLDVMGQEINVTDGATVGRQVRKAMAEAGAPEEEWVYVHRKHIRIDVDDGFYLTRLGDNSLTVNGRLVEKGGRVQIEDGDEIGFSDVVTATVSIR